MDLAILLVAAIASFPALVANNSGRTQRMVLQVFLLHFFGLIASAIGLFALMFHGYVEDSGVPPSNTLPVAIPLLAIGAMMLFAGGRLVKPRRRPTAPYRCPMCRTYFDELDELRVHRRTCSAV
jgi:hypothetical protein